VATRIEPLRNQHDRHAFSCGEPDLDDWFRHRAGQDSKRDLSQVFVAVGVDEEAALGVVGFYSPRRLAPSTRALVSGGCQHARTAFSC
jgi:hypothetical protein